MFGLHLPTLAELMWLPGLIIGFTVHELGHALVAYWMGDRGDLTRERLTLNPIKHVSWLGLAAFLLLGFGWAKPVRLRPAAFKHTNLGTLLVSLAGVTANAILAFVFLILVFFIAVVGSLIAAFAGADSLALRYIVFAEDPSTPLSTLVGSLAGSIVNINVVLAIFNLLPIPGFDGFHALLSLWRLVKRYQLPEEERQAAQALVAFEEGNYHARRGQMAQAVEAWRRAARLYPRFYGALYNLGLAYSQAGQHSAALGVLANARLAAQGESQQQQVDVLLRQAGWEGGESPPPVEPGTLPGLLTGPQPTDQESAASRRRVLKIAGIAVGVIIGLAAYTILMTFLALLAAGMQV